MTARRLRPLRPAAVRTVGLALLLTACVGSPEPAADPGPSAGSPSADAATPACPEVTTRSEVPPLHPSVDRYPVAAVTLRSPDGSCELTMAVRHADTPDRRAHGLMEVPELPDGTGMLFTYPDVDGDRTGGYWMANTLVPLDIAYVGGDGIIVDIVAMEPCDPDGLPDGERCPSYPPDAPYRVTLEVPQGWFARAAVTEGWQLSWSGLR